jgi:hypothetical protein
MSEKSGVITGGGGWVMLMISLKVLHDIIHHDTFEPKSHLFSR